MMINKIILLGPTASGKTSLAVQLARKIDAEIISVDSRQCYKYLDIGTAKPSPVQLAEIPHHNISVLDPEKEDSVVDFQKRAKNYAEDILARGKKAIYAGGSTLHLQALLQPLDDIPDSDMNNIRLLEKEAEREGLDKLFHRLQSVDPEYAEQMDGLNPQRIYRALDVWMQTSKPFSFFHTNKEIIIPGDTLVIGLHLKREILYNKINLRVDQMIKAGLIDETRSLLEAGLSPESQSLNTVGYKQVISHLNNELSVDEMADEIKTKTRRYAKRQLTWFRRWDFIRWLDADHQNEKKLLADTELLLAAKLQKP
jgi:tRNA dimethylallyltransferase